ncbi:MAG: UDP-N-acetylglucosamine diphosphorylase [Clostridia bacterium]|nr:UDP-N-acetylglucosamine diphosphorylase [Clostridia bacterium]
MDNKQRIKIIENHAKNGVEFVCTDGVIISEAAVIESGVIIYPGTIIEGASRICSGAIIGPNTMIVESQIGVGTRVNASQVFYSTVGNGTHVGPFAHIRPDCSIGNNVKLGAFVEVKNSELGDDTSLAHHCYVGDSEVGKNVNFGCGTIVVNYDGIRKYRTVVGDDAFIGCNSNLVAPVTIGEGAFIAAGTTVTGEVERGSLAIGRVRPTIKEQWADRYFNKPVQPK